MSNGEHKMWITLIVTIGVLALLAGIASMPLPSFADVEKPPVIRHEVTVETLKSQPLLGSQPNIFLIYVDGCQYIGLSDGHGIAIAHKGDCSNPIHHPTTDRREQPSGKSNSLAERSTGR
jgi:hypothetical protein